MSIQHPSTISKRIVAILECFSNVKPSGTVDHLVRYLGTWNGSDKLFMVIQYILKLLVPILNVRARLQHRVGMRKTATSKAAENYTKLEGIIGDSRTLWRIWGLLPIFQWLVSLERTTPASRNLLTIERLQGWSMLLYYPLEHLSYLRYHGLMSSSIPSPLSIFSSEKKRINLDPGILSRWSCRFWAAYVILQFFHLIEDRKLLKQRHSSIRRAKGTGLTKEEKNEIRQGWDAFWSEVVVNLGYLPLTVHWSLEKGLFNNEAWVGIFGLIAAAVSFRTGWKATTIPPPPRSPEKKGDQVEDLPSLVSGYNVES